MPCPLLLGEGLGEGRSATSQTFAKQKLTAQDGPQAEALGPSTRRLSRTAVRWLFLNNLLCPWARLYVVFLEQGIEP